MILACDKCGDVASQALIQRITDTENPELFKHDCGGIYRLMEKWQAADIMITHELNAHGIISR